MLIGYARVSTEDQNLDLQRDALTRAGCERIFEDRRSGAKADRPGLTDALDYARSGDRLVEARLDGNNATGVDPDVDENARSACGLR